MRFVSECLRVNVSEHEFHAPGGGIGDVAEVVFVKVVGAAQFQRAPVLNRLRDVLEFAFPEPCVGNVRDDTGTVPGDVNEFVLAAIAEGREWALNRTWPF
jgi:hypothetical protein